VAPGSGLRARPGTRAAEAPVG